VWTQFGRKRSGIGYHIGRIAADVMAWNDTLAVTGQNAVTVATLEERWQMPVSKGVAQVEALALAGDSAIAAIWRGRECTLNLIATKDGRVLAEAKLHARLASDGFAVSGGRVFSSLHDGTVTCHAGP
jgi:hypothetical protein